MYNLYNFFWQCYCVAPHKVPIRPEHLYSVIARVSNKDEAARVQSNTFRCFHLALIPSTATERA